MVGVVGERMRRRDVWRTDLRDRRRASDGLAGRRHHVGGTSHGGILACRSGSSGSEVLSLVAATRVGVVVNARVASKFVGTAEALGAAGELTSMRLLTGMGSNMTSLMFQAVESPVAKRTFIRTRQILTDLLIGGTSTLHERR